MQHAKERQRGYYEADETDGDHEDEVTHDEVHPQRRGALEKSDDDTDGDVEIPLRTVERVAVRGDECEQRESAVGEQEHLEVACLAARRAKRPRRAISE